MGQRNWRHDTRYLSGIIAKIFRQEEGREMLIQLEIIVIAAVVAIGLIVLGKAIMTGLAISRRPSHHLAERTGTSPVPPEAQIPPPNH